jgi:hypothetical protein
MWKLRSSLDHPGDAEEWFRSVGRLSENCVSYVAGKHSVVTEFRLAATCRGEEDLRHRFDVRDVELLELVDIGEDLVELAAIPLDFLGRQFQVRQFSDSQNIFTAYLQFPLPVRKIKSPVLLPIRNFYVIENEPVSSIPNRATVD